MYDIAILCGGFATRLGEITSHAPKSLIDINGKPFIHYQLELLKKSGFKRVILCSGHLSYKIKNYVDSIDVGMDIIVSKEEGNLLGTGGAIKNALNLLGDKFFVMYGDSYLDTDYCDIQDSFEDQDKLGMMTIYKNGGLKHSNNVVFEDNKIVYYGKEYSSKMCYIDYGLGVFYKGVFEGMKSKKFDLTQVYQGLIFCNQLGHYISKNRFYEIGSYEGIEELRRYLKNGL